MFQYLILGAALLVVVVLLGRWFATSPPSSLAKWLKWAFIGIAGAAAIFLGVTGRIQLAFLPLALMIIPRLIGFMQRAQASGQPQAGNASEITTAYLRMMLDHDSGDMEGWVLRGAFEGRALDDLSEAELIALHGECERFDVEGARLLETYLDRSLGPDWRERAGQGESSEKAGDDGGHRRRARPNGKMTRDEAFEVLGLEPDASENEIKDAHRKLMLKLHPDQGGSTYLAAKINQAKELLLGQ